LEKGHAVIVHLEAAEIISDSTSIKKAVSEQALVLYSHISIIIHQQALNNLARSLTKKRHPNVINSSSILKVVLRPQTCTPSAKQETHSRIFPFGYDMYDFLPFPSFESRNV
jgi:hypothetical protein